MGFVNEITLIAFLTNIASWLYHNDGH